ncbi:MAG: fatty acid cis/trans isomerase [Methylococcales bacterium]|nr:fatty acid cis/trans isomerase [Methylococcales bacterium]
MEKDALYSQFGLRRTHPKLWQHVDWFNQQYKEEKGISAGLLDMSRYENL